jgi:penicillin-binding protein 1B
MSPLQVTHMYQTYASGGFRMPLRAINAVLAADNAPLQRYSLSVQTAVDPAYNYLVTTAMRYAVREGTGRGIYQALPESQDIAGKTGTTDDLRDSWFAGFTGDRLGIVWIGRDDNQSTGLTGSTGALTVWRDLFRSFKDAGQMQAAVENIEYQWVEPKTGYLADADCQDAVQLPFVTGSAPVEHAACVRKKGGLATPVDWFKELFQ